MKEALVSTRRINVERLSVTSRYEPGLVVAEGDYMILRGRFSGMSQAVSWIVADMLRIENGLLAEHWDVIQNEASRETAKSGLPMSLIPLPKATRIWPRPPAVPRFRWWAFGNKFPE